ncbi:MAG: prenyltransferase [Caldilineaceae bacterium]
MQVTDHNFTATQPLQQMPNPQGGASTPTPIDAVRLRLYKAMHRRPRTPIAIATRLTQSHSALALTMPTLCGAILAWWELGKLSNLTLLFSLGSVLLLALGMQTLAEYCDYTHARKDPNATEITPRLEPLITGYGLMMQGVVQPSTVASLAYWLLTASILCTLWLTMLIGWPILFFHGLSFLLAYTYATPPVQYSYRGWALGEIGVFLAYGLLPLVGSYYTQSHTLSWLPLWVSVPFGLLPLLVFFNYNLVHEYRDWLMHKRTLVVNLSTSHALDTSAIVSVLIYIAILCIVSLAHLPLSTLITLAALPTALGVFSRLRQTDVLPEDRYWLYKTTVNAALWTSLLFCIALFTDKWL